MFLGSKRIFLEKSPKGRIAKGKSWESGEQRVPGRGEHSSEKEQRNMNKDELYLDFISAYLKAHPPLQHHL